MKTFHVVIDGRITRMPEAALRAGLQDGSIPPTALLWSVGMADWQTAASWVDPADAGPALPEAAPAPPEPAVRPRAVPRLLLLGLTVALAVAVAMLALDAGTVVDVVADRSGALPAVVALGVLHAVLLVVGVLLARAAWRHPVRRIRSGAVGSLFLLAAVITTVQLAFTLNWAVSFTDVVRITEAVLASQNATVEALAPGEIGIVGEIGPQLLTAIAAVEATNGTTKTIEISSPGGLVNEALILAARVEAGRIRTIVRDECQSACILIAVASPESYAEAGAVFGFHRGSPVVDVGSEVAIDAARRGWLRSRKFLADHGVPESVLRQADDHGPDSVFVVSAADLVDYGALRGIIEGDEVVTVGKKR